jgi:hypothetical protein
MCKNVLTSAGIFLEVIPPEALIIKNIYWT